MFLAVRDLVPEWSSPRTNQSRVRGCEADERCKPTKKKRYRLETGDQAQGQHRRTCTSCRSEPMKFILLQNIYIQTPASFHSRLRGSKEREDKEVTNTNFHSSPPTTRARITKKIKINRNINCCQQAMGTMRVHQATDPCYTPWQCCSSTSEKGLLGVKAGEGFATKMLLHMRNEVQCTHKQFYHIQDSFLCH